MPTQAVCSFFATVISAHETKPWGKEVPLSWRFWGPLGLLFSLSLLSRHYTSTQLRPLLQNPHIYLASARVSQGTHLVEVAARTLAVLTHRGPQAASLMPLHPPLTHPPLTHDFTLCSLGGRCSFLPVTGASVSAFLILTYLVPTSDKHIQEHFYFHR